MEKHARLSPLRRVAAAVGLVAAVGCGSPLPPSEPLQTPVSRAVADCGDEPGFECIPYELGGRTTARSYAHLAWGQFVALNRYPAAGGPETVWESWVSAPEVFANPDCQPQWPTRERTDTLEDRLVQQELLRRGETGVAVRDDNSEVHFNRSAFNWIVTRGFWYLDKQIDNFTRYKAGRPIDVRFPQLSVAVKAAWTPIAPEQKGSYHWREEGGELLGLNALHIASKIQPDWFWATWEHVDNPDRAAVAHPDPYGFPQGKLSTELRADFEGAGMDSEMWQHYRLNGTQATFTDSEGRPTILANSIIEAGFTSSSCMTCHARATVDGQGKSLPIESEHVGAPDPMWFGAPGPTARYLQQDFLFSLARAQPAGPGSDPTRPCSPGIAPAPSPGQ